MIHVDNALLKLKETDGYLEPYLGEVRMHLDRYNHKRWLLAKNKKLNAVINGHLYFGFHRTEKGWVFREWLPGADRVWLYGDFNKWEKYTHPLKNIGDGVWEIELKGKNALKHGQFVKLIVGRDGNAFERIPAYIHRTVLNMELKQLCGQIWAPEKAFAARA